MDTSAVVEKSFRVQSRRVHLTYAGHHDGEQYVSWLRNLVGDLKWYSIVWERSTAEIAYDHTHVAFHAYRKIDSSNQRKFDYDGVHPHIKVIRSNEQARHVWGYHEKAPVKSWRSEENPCLSKSFYQDIIDAPSLVDAIKASGVEVKSVQDVKTIRGDRSQDQVIPSLEVYYKWNYVAPPFRCLYVQGSTGIGKTRWSLAQFEQPLLVSHLEDLKGFKSHYHDGIVFDDISINHLAPTVAIHLLDWELPRTIKVLYGSINIPAKVRKIWTSNCAFSSTMPHCNDETFAALYRRVTVFMVPGKMYDESVTVQPPVTPVRLERGRTGPFSQDYHDEGEDILEDTEEGGILARSDSPCGYGGGGIEREETTGWSSSNAYLTPPNLGRSRSFLFPGTQPVPARGCLFDMSSLDS